MYGWTISLTGVCVRFDILDRRVKLAENQLRVARQDCRRAADEERRDARLSPAVQLATDLVGRSDEGDVLDHPQRDRRRGLGLLALQVQVLHRGGDVLVAHPGEHLEVEVGAT